MAVMLDQTMSLATQMRDSPRDITRLLQQDMYLDKQETLQSFRSLAESVKNPIHPTDAFDYIMGKSSFENILGAISFQLLVPLQAPALEH